MSCTGRFKEVDPSRQPIPGKSGARRFPTADAPMVSVDELQVPSDMSNESKKLKRKKWLAAFDSAGRMTRLPKLLRSILEGGIEESIRAEVWEYLLGCYSIHSTEDERAEIRDARRRRYTELVEQCRQMHSSMGTGQLAYTVGSKMMDVRVTDKSSAAQGAKEGHQRLAEYAKLRFEALSEGASAGKLMRLKSLNGGEMQALAGEGEGVSGTGEEEEGKEGSEEEPKMKEWRGVKSWSGMSVESSYWGEDEASVASEEVEYNEEWVARAREKLSRLEILEREQQEMDLSSGSGSEDEEEKGREGAGGAPGPGPSAHGDSAKELQERNGHGREEGGAGPTSPGKKGDPEKLAEVSEAGEAEEGRWSARGSESWLSVEEEMSTEGYVADRFPGNKESPLTLGRIWREISSNSEELGLTPGETLRAEATAWQETRKKERRRGRLGVEISIKDEMAPAEEKSPREDGSPKWSRSPRWGRRAKEEKSTGPSPRGHRSLRWSKRESPRPEAGAKGGAEGGWGGAGEEKPGGAEGACNRVEGKSGRSRSGRGGLPSKSDANEGQVWSDGTHSHWSMEFPDEEGKGERRESEERAALPKPMDPVVELGMGVTEERVAEWLWTLHKIVVDVVRTDQHLEFYQQPANMARVSDILAVHAWIDQDTGYCQGMCDLVSPFVILFENNADAFWCFECLISRVRHNFLVEGPVGVMRQLEALRTIVALTDGELLQRLQDLCADTFMFAFRMLLVLFRRELPFNDAITMWEMMWAADFDPLLAQGLLQNPPNALALHLPGTPSGGIEVPPPEEVAQGPLFKGIWRMGVTSQKPPVLSRWGQFRDGDEDIAVFCVVAIMRQNRRKLMKELEAAEDAIKMFNDVEFTIEVRSCVQTAIKLRTEYLRKLSKLPKNLPYKQED